MGIGPYQVKSSSKNGWYKRSPQTPASFIIWPNITIPHPNTFLSFPSLPSSKPSCSTPWPSGLWLSSLSSACSLKHIHPFLLGLHSSVSRFTVLPHNRLDHLRTLFITSTSKRACYDNDGSQPPSYPGWKPKLVRSRRISSEHSGDQAYRFLSRRASFRATSGEERHCETERPTCLCPQCLLEVKLQ